MKLTTTQEDVLTRMKAGAIAHYMPFMGRFRPNAYWFLSDNQKKCTKAIEKLLKLNIIKITKSGFHNEEARYL